MFRMGFQAATLEGGPAVGLVLSLSVGLCGWCLSFMMITAANEQHFQGMAAASQRMLDSRIASYINLLRAAGGLFESGPEVDQDVLQRFVEKIDIDRQYPALTTINYLQWVKDQDRDAFEARYRQAPAPYGPSFRIKPPGRRPEYNVVTFVEPRDRAAGTLGLDLTAAGIVRQSRAFRERGEVRAGEYPIPVMLSQETIGFAARLPVYRTGVPHDTPRERAAAFVGSVGIAINVEKLVQGALDEIPARGVKLILLSKRDGSVLYDSEGYFPFKTSLPLGLASEMQDQRRFHVVLPITFGDLQWNAYFSVPREALASASDRSYPWLVVLAATACSLLLYGVIYMLAASRRRAFELAKAMTRRLRDSRLHLLRSHQRLRELSAHAEHVKEQERKRIAREIHDDLGQNLMALKIDAQLLSQNTRNPRVAGRLHDTLKQIDITIGSMRRIINDLRPQMLDVGLSPAVAWQTEEFQRRTGVPCQLVEACEVEAGDEVATALFRILQESLNNVQRHAQARRVEVALGAADGKVSLRVRDDGVGIRDRGPRPGSFGLRGMEERVQLLGGRMELDSAPGCGTTVSVTLPLERRHEPVAA